MDGGGSERQVDGEPLEELVADKEDTAMQNGGGGRMKKRKQGAQRKTIRQRKMQARSSKVQRWGLGPPNPTNLPPDGQLLRKKSREKHNNNNTKKTEEQLFKE